MVVRALPLLLGLVLAALGAVVAPAFSRTGWVPRAEDWEAPVPAEATVAASAASGRSSRALVTHAPVRAPGRFDLVGFRWRSSRAATVQVRVRRDGGRWSRWGTAAAAADHGARHATDPVWTGGADVYQVRTSRGVRGLRAHFVNVSGTRTAADRIRTALRRAARAAFVALLPGVARAQAAPGDGRPAIVPRSSWDPGHQCDPTHAPRYGRVDLAFVHHTINLNTYGPADSASIVLAICRYHVRSNGWWDIGYNFLVDRYGRIFEGRAGGVDRSVIGAHAEGYNGVSTGVASIGTFNVEGQTPAGLRALGRIIGWRLGIAGVHARGTVVVESEGGPLSRYPKGTRIRLARVSGHRDGDATSCPGDALYAQLPAIRARAAPVARSVAPVARLSLDATPRVVRPGGATTLRGRLFPAAGSTSTGVPGAVEIERRAGRRWAPVTATALTHDLHFAARVRIGRPHRFRGVAGRTISPSVLVRVRPRLTLRGRRRGRTGILSGRIRPPVRRVVLETRLRADGSLVRRRSLRAGDGSFGVRVTLAAGTGYSFRARVPGRDGYAPARSRRVVLRAP